MYKKFFFNLFLITIPFSLLIILVNVKVDTGFVINNHSEQIANILLSGKNAAIINVPSQWGSLQKAIVLQSEKIKKEPSDIIVFGTSRSSEINASIFYPHSFFNCPMPGGNMLDYIALYGMYKKSNLLPKYLIIAIDPWTFHSRKGVTINKEMQHLADPSIPLKVNTDLINDFEIGLKYLNNNKTENVSNAK